MRMMLILGGLLLSSCAHAPQACGDLCMHDRLAAEAKSCPCAELCQYRPCRQEPQTPWRDTP